MILTDHNAQALGYQTALNFLPGLLLTPWTGSVADRFAKHKILGFTQSILLIDAAVLSFLAITGHAKLWMVYLITFIDGLASSFDNPARQAIVSEIVPKNQLANAISLNSASFNTARLLGPGVSGFLIAWIGTGQTMAVNIISFASLLVCITALDKSKFSAGQKKTSSNNRGFMASLRYVNRRPDLKLLLTIGFVVGGLSFNFQITNALMATEAYGKMSGEYGILGSLMGSGALAAALLSARRAKPRLRYAFAGMIGYSVFSTIAVLSPSYWLFAVMQIPIGFVTITCLVTCNAMLQTSSSQHMRGRIMALWVLVFAGVTPLVSPLIGWLGENIGPRSAVIFGIICVSSAALILIPWVMWHDSIRVHIDRKAHGWLTIEHPIPATDPRGGGTIGLIPENSSKSSS